MNFFNCCGVFALSLSLWFFSLHLRHICKAFISRVTIYGIYTKNENVIYSPKKVFKDVTTLSIKICSVVCSCQ